MPPKRKRAATLSKDDDRPKSAASEKSQSTRRSTKDDAREDAHEQAQMDPPAKRTRASSSATSSSKRQTAADSSQDNKKSSGSQSSYGRQVSMPIDGAAPGSGENGEAGTLRMEAPPPAGSVDPVGYHTNAPPTDRPVRVYADGVFDLFHLGHMRQLQQAKTAFPGHDVHLIVGVTGDKETHTRKGLTVMSGAQRAESLRHCRWVDEVVEDCPWILTPAFLAAHRIDFVAHDDLPYGASEGDDIYAPIKARGQFLVTQRTDGVSTTAIITTIVRDYEKYIARQLRRGESRHELNVSWLKKNELELKRHVADLRDQIRANWSATGSELSRELRHFFWERGSASRPSSPAASSRQPRGAAAASSSLFNGRGGRRHADDSGSGAQSPVSPVAGNGDASATPSGRAGSSSSSARRGKGSNLDFAAGYAMGLFGGVRGWMEGSKRRNLSDSRAQSPDESPERSPAEDGDEDDERGQRLSGEVG